MIHILVKDRSEDIEKIIPLIHVTSVVSEGVINYNNTIKNSRGGRFSLLCVFGCEGALNKSY